MGTKAYVARAPWAAGNQRTLLHMQLYADGRHDRHLESVTSYQKIQSMRNYLLIENFIDYVIVRPLSTVGYTSVVASVIHNRQWSN